MKYQEDVANQAIESLKSVPASSAGSRADHLYKLIATYEEHGASSGLSEGDYRNLLSAKQQYEDELAGKNIRPSIGGGTTRL